MSSDLWNLLVESFPKILSAGLKMTLLLTLISFFRAMVIAVIAALGCSPGLGFVHVGHENSFVYDVADLYKAEITIPLAFEVAAECGKEDVAGIMRRRTRDAMTKAHILERMVHDIRYLFQLEGEESEADAVFLWDNQHGTVENGRSWRED